MPALRAGGPRGISEVVDKRSKLSLGGLPDRRAEDVGWPGRGQAWRWLEAGASEALPVVNTPEEADRLKELGYR